MHYNEFIRRLFDRAGADQPAEAVYSAGSSFEVQVRDGEILQYSVSDNVSLTFRVLAEDRMGTAFTQILDDEAVDMLVDGARENAALIESEDRQFFYAGGGDYPALKQFNPEIEEISASEKIEMARELERLTLAQDPRIRQVEDCGILSVSAEDAIVNTGGLNVGGRANLLGGYVVAIAREGERANTGTKTFFITDPKMLNLEAVARAAAMDALSGLNAAPVPSGEYRVLLRNDAAAALLSTFSGVFSADNAQRGLSLLKGREGEMIAAPCVTVMDDPHLPGGGASAAYDGEGVPTRMKRIVDGGRLTTLMHNLKTAHKQGVETTANASSGKGIAPSNFYFAPSRLSAEEMLKRTGDGLLITGMMGMHAGANAISGDFSLAAKGFRVRGGEVAEAVDQITIAGNFYSLLKNIEAVGSDLDFRFPGGSCFGSPSILVSALAVAGK